jgi:hypothetical protein
LSGQKKGDYSKVTTDEYDIHDDFSTTLSKSKQEDKKRVRVLPSFIKN